MSKNHKCKECEKEFENGWTGAKYCSGACKQKAYRTRHSTVTNKSKSGHCARCENRAKAGSMYCSNSCKVLTNREKQHATFRRYQWMHELNPYDAWFACEGRWKEVYREFEAHDMFYNIREKSWQRVGQNLELPLGELE